MKVRKKFKKKFRNRSAKNLSISCYQVPCSIDVLNLVGVGLSLCKKNAKMLKTDDRVWVAVIKYHGYHNLISKTADYTRIYYI